MKETEGTPAGWEIGRDKSQESAGVNTALQVPEHPSSREEWEGQAQGEEPAGPTLPQTEKNQILLDSVVQKDTKEEIRNFQRQRKIAGENVPKMGWARYCVIQTVLAFYVVIPSWEWIARLLSGDGGPK